jgi:hypothetical protein
MSHRPSDAGRSRSASIIPGATDPGHIRVNNHATLSHVHSPRRASLYRSKVTPRFDFHLTIFIRKMGSYFSSLISSALQTMVGSKQVREYRLDGPPHNLLRLYRYNYDWIRCCRYVWESNFMIWLDTYGCWLGKTTM